MTMTSLKKGIKASRIFVGIALTVLGILAIVAAIFGPDPFRIWAGSHRYLQLNATPLAFVSGFIALVLGISLVALPSLLFKER